MNVKEFMNELFRWCPTDINKRPRDILVWGDESREVSKVAVCQIATPEVLRKAKEIGASMILTHEPTFPTFLTEDETNPVYAAKLQLVCETNLPIYRFHDAPHFSGVDQINAGLVHKLNLAGEFDGHRTFTLQEEMTIAELEECMEKRLGLHHIRFVGEYDKKVKTISLCAGAWGEKTLFEQLNRSEIDLVICGEIMEWNICEYVRDGAQLGLPYALFILGHMGSEGSGMEYVAEYINKHISGVTAEYVECGEVYSN